ncbi:MAG: saccharopine dehydrogenase NADP-binding domain-containing protein [Bacteroidetes bacterium]|nr:saccharopine dehydrogenase NADP-binding domain-containing protein [Bacteroidota bacterium]
MTKKVLILGAGLVARPIVKHLLSQGFCVTVASNTPDRAARMINNHPSGMTLNWEATDETALDALIGEHDLTVSLLPYTFHVMVARHCIAHKKNMVTTSYVKPEMRELDGQARQAGIIILNEIGLDPGIDHMSAMRIIDHIHMKEGAVLEFYSICGALPAPEAAGNPFKYKFSWSPKGVVMAGNNDALYLRHGKIVSVPTKELFNDPFTVDFPEVGRLEVYPNRDSLAYRDIYGIPEAQTVYRGTFRFKGWCESLNIIKQLGLISYENSDMSGMSYAGLIGKQLKNLGYKPGIANRNIRFDVAGCLGIPIDSHALDAMDWLGLFEDKPMNRKTDSTFEVVSDLMISKMGLGDKERDMVVLQHSFLAAYSDGRKEVIRSRMLDFGSPATDTSIARTVALPAAIGVEMILKGEIREKGVHIPVIPSIYEPVLNALEALGIKMTEEFGLPVSENIK